MSTAQERARQRRMRQQRKHWIGGAIALLCLAMIPVLVWQLSWPFDLLAALPLGLVGLYLGLVMPRRGS